jgi:hypothetical protein
MHARTRPAVGGLLLLTLLGCTSQAPQPSTAPSVDPTPTASPTGSPSTAPTGSPAPSPTADTAGWTVTTVAPMLRARDGFRVQPLGDETVLVVGDDHACHPGPAEPGSETAERYDPIADEWTVAASLNKPRQAFAMVPSEDGGVLVIGGINAEDQPYSSTKRLDLDAATWVDGPLTTVAYGQVAAATLEDGRIFVIGPTTQTDTSTTSMVESLAPGSDSWEVGDPVIGPSVHELTALGDGTLLGTGIGWELPYTLVILDPDGDHGWQPFPAPAFDIIERIVPFRGGMLAFGTLYDPAGGDVAATSPNRWDPIAGAWIETGPMAAPRTGAAIATLADGRVLVMGGIVGGREPGNGEIVRSSEVYDPVSGTWSAGPDMGQLRYGGQAVVLDDGSVLLLGGLDQLNEFGDTPFCAEPLTVVERIVPAAWTPPEV